MASGGITGEPVQTARLGSYMRTTGGGTRRTVTQRDTSGGGSSTQRKTTKSIEQGNAERQLNNLVNKSRGDSNYRNRANVYTVNEILDKSNPLNLSKRERDFILRAGLRKDGTLNSAGAGRIANKIAGVSQDGAFIGDDRTAYQRDLNNFRIASPANEAAYVRRFPKTAAFEKILRKGAEGIVGTPGRIIKNLTDNYLDGVKNMVEKISGVEAKNVEIAKDKDTDINTIVNNLQRNIKEERDDGKVRGMTEADLTAMYGEPIDIETGDDIFGGDLLGMEMLEEDSPLRAQDVAPGFPRADVTGREDDVAPDPFPRTDITGRAEDVAPDPFPRADVTGREDDVAPGFDLTAPDDLIDLSGTSGRDLINDPIEGQATAAGQGLVYADGTPIMEYSPTPLFDSEIDEEAIRKAIEGKADGGQIFGNQNMSTFAKLKAIADGIADNK